MRKTHLPSSVPNRTLCGYPLARVDWCTHTSWSGVPTAGRCKWCEQDSRANDPLYRESLDLTQRMATAMGMKYPIAGFTDAIQILYAHLQKRRPEQ